MAHDRGIIFQKGERKKNLILFVHGLGGDAYTFLDARNEPNLFIRAILKDSKIAEDFNWGVYEYYTKSFGNFFWLKWGLNKIGLKSIKPRQSLSISTISKTLKTELEERCQEYDKIVVIAHSMGGLITKETILNELTSNQISQIDLFVSLAVPHLGSKWSNFAKTFSPNVQLSNLQLFDNYVIDLYKKWNKNKNNIPETLYVVGHNDKVVNYASAQNMEIDVNSVKNTTRDHNDIIKPKTSKDIVVLSVINFINKELHQEIPTGSYLTCDYPRENQTLKGSTKDNNSTFHTFKGKILKSLPDGYDIWVFYELYSGVYYYPPKPIDISDDNTWSCPRISLSATDTFQIYFTLVPKRGTTFIENRIKNGFWSIEELPNGSNTVLSFPIKNLLV